MACSLCHLPYRGRQAKRLACGHTFCLPCLTGLVENTQVKTSVTAGQEEDEDGGSVTCPTCRRVINVPAGGVSAFQNDFDMETQNGEEDAQPAPSSVRGGQNTQVHCGNVRNVYVTSGPAQEASGSVSRPGDGGTVSSARADPKNWKDLHDKLEDLAARVNWLQITNTQLLQQVTQLNNSNSKLWSEQSTLQGEVRTLKEQNVKLTSEQAALQREVTSMRDKHALVHQDLAVLTAEKDKARADLSKLQKAVASMETNIQSAQDSLQDNRKALTALETRLVTATTQVAFHACLSTEVTTNKEQRTLICDRIFSNVGGGYDGGTGVFTAPLAGTYCFLANSSPNEPDVDIRAKLEIVVDNKMKGYVFSKGHSWSTGHTAVKMNAGQKVWLRTCGDGKYTFSDGGWTTFSGMLLQPDV